ncbi:unnamed protein product, partial [Coregonus sp. 'balchen']
MCQPSDAGWGHSSSPICQQIPSYAAEQGHEEICRMLFQCCPSLWDHANKSLVPYQLAPDGLLKELLEHPR